MPQSSATLTDATPSNGADERPGGYPSQLRAAFAFDYAFHDQIDGRRDVSGKVRAAQIAAVSRYSRAIMAGNIFNASILLVTFAATPLAGVATAWTFGVVAYSLFIYLRQRAYRGRPIPRYASCRGVRRALVNAVLMGTMWGLVPLFFLGGTSGSQLVVVSLCIGMMCAGCFVLAPIPLAAAAYLVPIALATCCAFVREGAAYHLVCLLLLSYLIVLLASVAAHAGQFIARVLEQDEAERTAALDPLTQLPNRNAFMPALETAVERCRIYSEAFALFSIDLDGFKGINDRMGHPAGDQLLIQVAARMSTVVRPSDLLARVGGDEFTLLARGVASPMAAAEMAERLLGVLAGGCGIAGEQVRPGLSIGIALAPSDGLVADTLMERADAALYQAKRNGRNGYRLFQIADDESIRRRKTWTRDLHQAIANAEMHLVFQPITNFSGTVEGFEALLRWTHPHLGPISPADFIPVAERSGLIREIGVFVIDEACRAAATWPAHTHVSVNFSLDQFRSLSIVDIVREALTRHGLATERFEVEVTESILFQDEPIVLQTIEALHAAGFRIVLDDFGTGFSSLRHLQDFPIGGVKIDRAFTSGLPGNRRSQAIIRAILDMCGALGIRVTAEGIETGEQMLMLSALGCHEAQGFWIGRPKPEADAHALCAGAGTDARLVA